MKYQAMVIEHFRTNMSVYLFMATLLVTGIVFGAIIVNSMSFVQKQDLFFHIEQFFSRMITGEPIVHKDILIKSFFTHWQYLIVLFLLGLTIIGIPFIWLFIFLKGLAIGFSVGFMVNQLGFKGLFMATVSIAPQNMLIIPVYLLAGSLSMLFSLLLFRKITSKDSRLSLRLPLIQYVAAFVLFFALAFLASLVETFISYEAVKIAIKTLT